MVQVFGRVNVKKLELDTIGLPSKMSLCTLGRM